MAIKQGSSQSN